MFSADFERSTSYGKAEPQQSSNFQQSYNPLSLVSKAYGADRFENSPTLLNHMDLSAKTATSASQPQVSGKMKELFNHNNSNSSFVDHNNSNANPLQLFGKIGGPLNFAGNQGSKEEASKVQRGAISQSLLGKCVIVNVILLSNIMAIISKFLTYKTKTKKND